MNAGADSNSIGAPHEHGANEPGARLMLAVGLTFAFAVVEVFAGWWSGSLALAGDAGHMLTDSAALLIAALAARLARIGPSNRHTFGMARVELMAALLNAVLMLAVVGTLATEAVTRLMSPVQIDGRAVTIVAGFGLLVNIVVARILSHDSNNLNERAALLHVIADALASVAALVSGVLVLVTGWMRIDPVLTLVISGLIGFSGVRLVRDSLHGLMEGVPFRLSLTEIAGVMTSTPGVMSVHDVHVWSVSGDRVAMSAHIVLQAIDSWTEVLPALQEVLGHRFGISHLTLQPELSGQVERMAPCDASTWSPSVVQSERVS